MLARKKVLFLASRFPYPARDGREKTLLDYLSFFAGKTEVYFYFFCKSPVEEKLIEDFRDRYKVKEVYGLTLPGLCTSVARVMFNTLLFRRNSIQENFFYSRKIYRHLRREISLKNVDIIFADMVRTAQYFEGLGDKRDVVRVFDMDDIFSKRYKYWMREDNINILGGFAKVLPNIVTVGVNKILKRIILGLESDLMAKREVELVKAYDRTILVSPHEAEEIRKLTGKHSIYYVYPSAIVRKTGIDIKKIPRSISFMGRLNVPHNEKAIVNFIMDVFPKVLNVYPDAKLFVIGSSPTESVKNAVAGYSSNIVLTGYVDDFSHYIQKTEVFVAPIYFGTGIKVKILDAMSLGMPVVTTPWGVEGLNVSHLKNIIVVRDSDSFAEFVVRLMEDKGLRDTISEGALKYIEEFHSPEMIRRRFLRVVGVE